MHTSPVSPVSQRLPSVALDLHVVQPCTGFPMEPGRGTDPVRFAMVSGVSGLAEALVDGEARMLLPEVKQVGVQRLARRGGVHERGQIEGVHVFGHHHAVHRGRTAECRDAVLADEREDLGGDGNDRSRT